MTEQAVQQQAGSLSAGDLAELMASFNEVTAKLESTHTQLRGEVARLNTELVQANEALQRSKRLAALGEMAAGISHEIRNPLGSIRLYTRMLQEDLAEMPEQCGIVDKIGRAVTGLDQIVGDVLAFSREIRASLTECNTALLLEDACDACVAELAEIKVSIEVDTQCNEIQGDASLLHQALINIIRNGAQATRDNGGESIVIGVSQTQEHRHVWVRDSGGGIEESVIERMFNPFFTTRAAGTGLGLSIVHRIMDAHGGSVQVKNNTDESGWTSGATVSLLLPKRIVNALPEDGYGQIVVRAGRMAESADQQSKTQSLEAQGEVA
jgi:signal transduction histidine kinase